MSDTNPNQHNKPIVTNFGGNGDCGFLSVAGSLIDKHRRGLLFKTIEQGHFYELLDLYRYYFPKLLPKEFESASPRDQFNHLAANTHPQVILQSLADVLRQHAVDLIVANAERYRGPFADNNEGTSPADMRKSGTWIDSTAIAALAHQFQIPIEVHCKTFTSKLYDGPGLCEEPIRLHLHGAHYLAEVQQPEYFIPADSDTLKQAKTKRPLHTKDPSLAEINRRIAKGEAKDKQREQDAKNAFKNCSTQQLLEMYRKAASTSDYLPGKIACVTNEQDGDLFFFNAIENNDYVNRNNDVRDVAIHALAKQANIDRSFNSTALIQKTRDTQSASKLSSCGLVARSEASKIDVPESEQACVTVSCK